MLHEYYDCHMHELGGEKGGMLIALDGRRGSAGGYDNEKVLKICENSKNIIPVQYVTWQFENTITPIVKYHPRRELYMPKEVEEDILQRKPSAVIIDTLNQPDWQASDYWKIAKKYEDIPFLFSHTGGFDMLQFLNIAMFQKNVWIDFSFVQNVFGFVGNNIPLPAITTLMDYGLNDERIYNKLLFGTDRMVGEEDIAPIALEAYLKYESYNRVTRDNYLRFIEQIKL